MCYMVPWIFLPWLLNSFWILSQWLNYYFGFLYLRNENAYMCNNSKKKKAFFLIGWKHCILMKIYLIVFHWKNGGKYWLSAAWGVLLVSSLPISLRNSWCILRHHMKERPQNQVLATTQKNLDSKTIWLRKKETLGAIAEIFWKEWLFQACFKIFW